jgi:hypothetical protein
MYAPAHAYHGLVTIHSDATVHESQKVPWRRSQTYNCPQVTVRLPCVFSTIQPAVDSSANGRRRRRRFDCALLYGSYARAVRWLSLRWHAYPLNDNMQVPCVDTHLQRPCALVTVTTSHVLNVTCRSTRARTLCRHSNRTRTKIWSPRLRWRSNCD